MVQDFAHPQYVMKQLIFESLGCDIHVFEGAAQLAEVSFSLPEVPGLETIWPWLKIKDLGLRVF